MGEFRQINGTNRDNEILRALLATLYSTEPLAPEVIAQYREQVFNLANPAKLVFDALRSLGSRLSSTGHGRGQRRRDVITSRDLANCLQSVPEVTVEAMVLAGGSWLLQSREKPENRVENLPSHDDDPYHKSWPKDGLVFEMVSYERTDRERLQQRAEAVATDFLASHFPSRAGSEQLLAYEQVDENNQTDAFVLDFCNEGERTVTAIALLAQPVDGKRLDAARLYFQGFWLVCSLLVRSERYREHGESLVNEMLHLSRTMSFDDRDRKNEIKGDDGMSAIFMTKILPNIQAFCESAAWLFEVEEVRVFLPGQGHELSICVASNRSKSHLIRLKRSNSLQGVPYNAASIVTWHHPANEGVHCRCLVHFASETRVRNPLEKPVLEWGREPGIDGIIDDANDVEVSIATIVGFDHRNMKDYKPGDPLPEETRRRILEGPTLLVHRKTALPYLDEWASSNLDSVVMLLGRNMDHQLIAVEGTASTHINRVDRIRAFADSFLTQLHVQLSFYLSEWRRAVRRRLVVFKEENPGIIATAREKKAKLEQQNQKWALLCEEIAKCLDAGVVSIFDLIVYKGGSVLQYRVSSRDVRVGDQKSERRGPDAASMDEDELRKNGRLYDLGAADGWLAEKHGYPRKGVCHDYYDPNQKRKVGFGDWEEFCTYAKLQPEWNTCVMPLFWRKRLIGLLRVDGAHSLFKSVLAEVESGRHEVVPNAFPKHIEPTMIDLADIISWEFDRGKDGVTRDKDFLTTKLRLGTDALKGYREWARRNIEQHMGYSFDVNDDTIKGELEELSEEPVEKNIRKKSGPKASAVAARAKASSSSNE